MTQRTGRPRVSLEKNVLEGMSAQDKQLETLIARGIDFNTPSSMAFEAASLLLSYETDSRKIRTTPIFQKINQYAIKNGPKGKWLGPRGACDFLEEFIHYHAPNWNWRAEAVKGGIEHRNYKQENERIAKDIAADARWRMARATKFHTPDVPDAGLLCALAWESRSKKPSKEEFERFRWSAWKHWLVIRKSGPTLRELKLATAIPERQLKKIISDLRPRRGEIIKEPLRHKFSGRGAMPLRYGPRLVIGVLNELENRLSEFSIEDKEREGLRKTILTVKRAFAARLRNSR